MEHRSSSPVETCLGGRRPRPDAHAKVSGGTRYLGDLELPGTLHASFVHSPEPAARLLDLDLEDALAVQGVEAILTARDIPGENQVGLIFPDQPILVDERIRMVGDRLALIAARTPESAARAARLARPHLMPLQSIHDPVAALDDDSPLVHANGNLIRTFRVERGEIEKAKRKAKSIVTAVYRVGGQEHAYIEPQGCMAIPEGKDRITIIASCQCPFYVQHAVARVLGAKLSAVRVEQAPTGGAFGGKEDYPSEMAASVALLAWQTGRPVRLILQRETDMQISTKRHAAEVRHTWGADSNGRICFAEVETFMDAGAYAGLSTVVAERTNVSGIGPYNVPAVRVKTHVVYTNNLFGGAFRGFGAPQVTVAHEATVDRLAGKIGIDPIEFRRKNLLDDTRRVTCTGQRLAKPVLTHECLDRAIELADRDKSSRDDDRSGAWVEGTGLNLAIYGCNLHHGGQRLDRSSAVVILQQDGSVIVRVGLTDMGQGNLAASQIVAAEALGVDPSVVQVWQPDSTTVADSGPTVASRGAHASGMAIIDAVSRLRRRLDPIAAELLDCPAGQLTLSGGYAFVSSDPSKRIPISRVASEMGSRRIESIATGWYRSKPRRYDPETGQGSPYEHYAVACHVARVKVDADLGIVQVVEVSAAHDVGRVIHRDALEGQIQGGIVQAMGWGITEQIHLNRGTMMNTGFTDYLIPTAADTPKINIAVIESEGAPGPFGAKGIGEPSFIPTAGAIRNAVCDALKIEIDSIPLTPPVIVSAIGEKHRFAKVGEPRPGSE